MNTGSSRVTRGWLVDTAGLGPGELVTPEHCAGIDPEPGDAVLFHTGWSRHWDEPDVYPSGGP
jgi:kynurenine formamidase